jgi:glutamate 5-kinase
MTTFGDNDRLAAMVTNLLRAPLLVLLSDVDGLYDGDPRAPGSNLIHTVTELDDKITGLVRDAGPGLGKGGMARKLAAARLVTTAGENCVIAGGRTPGNLAKILAGETVGTLFVPRGGAVQSRKRWIGYTAQPRGRVTIDAGARRALTEQGRSLLAIGITAVEGTFAKGDVVAIFDIDGVELARGLSNYSSTDVGKIKGLKSDAIAAALSHRPYDEVIHRDNMVLTGK